MISIDAHVGERVRTRRIASGHSEDAFAEMMGFSPELLRLKEDGRSRLDVRDLFKVHRLLGMQPADFYDGLSLFLD